MILHFINLKIGKASLIQIGDQGTLVDVGDQEDSKDLFNYLEDAGIKKISHIFLTNWSEENISGLSSLLQVYPNTIIYVPLLTADNYPVPTKFTYNKLGIGEQIILSEKPSISIEALSPLEPLFHDSYNDSLVCLLHYQKLSVLLTSDIHEEAEPRLIEKYPHLKAEIMTVPDRPSGVLHSKAFIKKMDPQTAVMMEMPCHNCKQIIKDAANSYSQEWSDFFFVPIGANFKILFHDGVYTTPKNQ
ncbi:MAG TPA: MBL fold metallo-hydrolase [Bacillota bacterium]|nr:MBL fold metallo-hydrolase [Bacillota bacterium]